MKNRKINSKYTRLWIALFLATDAFFIFIAWLISSKEFYKVALMIALFTIMVIFVGWVLGKNINVDSSEDDRYELDKKVQELNTKEEELKSYREFIEEWTHEIKTPLSLLTLVLENHKDEMSSYIYERMQHVKFSISEDIERILYYARLKVEHVDYRFERIYVPEFINELLEEFRPAISEKRVATNLEVAPVYIYTDRRVFFFIMAQLLSNAIKYSPEEAPRVDIICEELDGSGDIYISVRDNGKGVNEEDAPFIFDKGFTGIHTLRQSATGMGLYFVKKYSDALCITAELEEGSSCGKGFGIRITFPRVD